MASSTITGNSVASTGLSIVGGADEVQLLVKGNATQSTNVIESVQKSDGTAFRTMSGLGIQNLPLQTAVGAYRNADITGITAGTANLLCDVKDYDTQSNYTTGTGAFRPAGVAGLYLLTGCVRITVTVNSLTGLNLELVKNSTTIAELCSNNTLAVTVGNSVSFNMSYTLWIPIGAPTTDDYFVAVTYVGGGTFTLKGLVSSERMTNIQWTKIA